MSLTEGSARATESTVASGVRPGFESETRLCVTVGTSLVSPQFHISELGTITSTSEGCGKDQIGHK